MSRSRPAWREFWIGLVVMVLVSAVGALSGFDGGEIADRIRFAALDSALAARTREEPPALLPHIVVIKFDEAYRIAQPDGITRLEDVANAMTWANQYQPSALLIDVPASPHDTGWDALTKVLTAMKSTSPAGELHDLPRVVFPARISEFSSSSCRPSGTRLPRLAGPFSSSREASEWSATIGAVEFETDVDGKVRRLCPVSEIVDVAERGERQAHVPAAALRVAALALLSGPTKIEEGRRTVMKEMLRTPTLDASAIGRLVSTLPWVDEPMMLPAIVQMEDTSQTWLADGEQQPTVEELPAGRILEAFKSNDAAVKGAVRLKPGSIVVVGITHEFSGDYHRLPKSSGGAVNDDGIPGVFLHVNAIRESLRSLAFRTKSNHFPKALNLGLDFLIGLVGLLVGTVFWMVRFNREEARRKLGKWAGIRSQMVSMVLFALVFIVLAYSMLTLYVWLGSLNPTIAAEVNVAVAVSGLLYEMVSRLVALAENLFAAILE